MAAEAELDQGHRVGHVLDLEASELVQVAAVQLGSRRRCQQGLPAVAGGRRSGGEVDRGPVVAAIVLVGLAGVKSDADLEGGPGPRLSVHGRVQLLGPGERVGGAVERRAERRRQCG